MRRPGDSSPVMGDTRQSRTRGTWHDGRGRNRLRTTGGFLLALALLAVGCSGTGDSAGTATTLPDPPNSLPAAASPLVLEHETGLTFTVEVQNGQAEPPFLWDGTWRDRQHGTTFEIGGPERPLLQCWDTTQPGEVSADSIRCTQSTVSRIAYRDGYDTAAGVLDDALQTIGRASSGWGTYCHIGGYAAAAGAVLGGEDPRTLMRTKTSFCDYSVLHGVASAVASLHAEDPIPALVDICQADPGSTIPAFSYSSQCWHGGGFGLARIYRFDIEQASVACLGATESGWVSNCIEGAHSFLAIHRPRATGWSVPEPSADRCTAAPDVLRAQREYMIVCYRTVAERTRHAGLDERANTTDQLIATCRELTAQTELEGCWAGVGNALHLQLADDVSDLSKVRDLLLRCTEAVETVEETECLTRTLIGLVKNDQRPSGIEPEKLIELVRPERRAELQQLLQVWLDSIAGRSEHQGAGD